MLTCYTAASAVIHHCRVRSSLRRTYGLPPEPCPDCCVVCLCPCCAVIQEHNELDIRGATQWNAPPSDSKPIERNGNGLLSVVVSLVCPACL